VGVYHWDDLPKGVQLTGAALDRQQALARAMLAAGELDPPPPTGYSRSYRIPGPMIDQIIKATGLSEAAVSAVFDGQGAPKTVCAVQTALITAALAWKGPERTAILRKAVGKRSLSQVGRLGFLSKPHGHDPARNCRLVCRAGLAGAAAPGADARCRRCRAACAAGGRYRRGQDAGGVPAHAGGVLPLAAGREAPPEGLHTLYISPLKALAHDVQRNLLTPIAEMGLNLRVETRSGDTPSDRKARQRARPPHVLLTTPESLSLLLSYPEASEIFSGLKRVVIDEIHAFATGKRGDLLALALGRLQAISPDLQRAALSATVAEPEGFRGWLAPWGEIDSVALVEGEEGAPPEVEILLPQEERVPWGGHAAAWAVPQLIAMIRANRVTLVFTNTRFLAEYIFQLLWDANEGNLPIGIHHGSLSVEARRKVEGAMARGELRALVCTASLDLGVDWGDIDLVVQMGAPKGSSRLLQRIGRANHRLDLSSRAVLVPGNRFEYLEAMAARDAVHEGQRDGEDFRPGGLDVLAQHVMGCACAGPFREADLLREVRSCLAYAWVDETAFARVLDFVATGAIPCAPMTALPASCAIAMAPGG
jgi:hypothetical protein